MEFDGKIINSEEWERFEDELGDIDKFDVGRIIDSPVFAFEGLDEAYLEIEKVGDNAVYGKLRWNGRFDYTEGEEIGFELGQDIINYIKEVYFEK